MTILDTILDAAITLDSGACRGAQKDAALNLFAALWDLQNGHPIVQAEINHELSAASYYYARGRSKDAKLLSQRGKLCGR